jgi:hypothetical protein
MPGKDFTAEDYSVMFGELHQVQDVLNSIILRLKAGEHDDECISRAEQVVGAVKRLEWNLSTLQNGDSNRSVTEAILDEHQK